MSEIQKHSDPECDKPLSESCTVEPFNCHTLFMCTDA